VFSALTIAWTNASLGRKELIDATRDIQSEPMKSKRSAAGKPAAPKKTARANRRTPMQQVTRSIYLVDNGEVVTVEVEAIKVGNFVSLVIDGGSIDPISKKPLTYQFTVALAAGETHHGMITCFFPKIAPDDAEFDVFVSGSGGGGRFTGSDIVKTDASWTRSIEFRRP
jgi:hypothetical protein